jgi:hypothetical protein
VADNSQSTLDDETFNECRLRGVLGQKCWGVTPQHGAEQVLCRDVLSTTHYQASGVELGWCLEQTCDAYCCSAVNQRGTVCGLLTAVVPTASAVQSSSSYHHHRQRQRQRGTVCSALHRHDDLGGLVCQHAC